MKYGYCQCGCGGRTTIKNGVPRGFIIYHHFRIPRRGTLSDKYEIQPDSGCWEWKGHLSRDGYGFMRPDDGGNMVRAHRYVYEKYKGDIPKGLELDHMCRNRACVNPAHLQPVTHAENIRRSAASKLSVADVLCIRQQTNNGASSRELADRYSITTEHVRRIVLLQAWKEVA